MKPKISCIMTANSKIQYRNYSEIWSEKVHQFGNLEQAVFFTTTEKGWDRALTYLTHQRSIVEK